MSSSAFIPSLSLPGPSVRRTTTPLHLRHAQSRLLHGRHKMVVQNPPQPSPTTPQSTFSAVQTSPIIVCIRQKNPQIALQAAEAVIRGGLRAIEVALTTPDALSIIHTLSSKYPSAIIGAGTVLTTDQAKSVHSAGAKFALSPVYNSSVVQTSEELGMLAVPGAITPTEVLTAYEGGARVVKLFPINLYGGIDLVRALQGPLGHIPLLPTSGVDCKNLGAYLSLSNVWGVGASRQILTKEALQNERWEEVEQRARKWGGIAAEYRKRDVT